MHDNKVADAPRRSWVYLVLPQRLWPYAQLARWERPIGWKLLMWPCWWSFALALGTNQDPARVDQLPFASFAGFLPNLFPVVATFGLFALGAIVMRGAGCTYNDLVDREIDEQVERTRSRPLPSGRASAKQATIFLLLQLLAGFLILIAFNPTTIWLGTLSLVTVAIYPFMKRITWWPQFFLGISFSWGALVGWSALMNELAAPALCIYAGSVFWVIGYDTIYALQDVEDDAIVGIKSTARLFGKHTRLALLALYTMALAMFALALLLAQIDWFAFMGLSLGAGLLAWQVFSLDMEDGEQCLVLFKSNSIFGWILFLGILISTV